MNVKKEMVHSIMVEAMGAARAASLKYLNEELNGRDAFPCGFAWVDIVGIHGNSAIARELKQYGFRKMGAELAWWNPAGLSVQNVDAKYAGAEAAMYVLRKHGLSAFVNSRLD